MGGRYSGADPSLRSLVQTKSAVYGLGLDGLLLTDDLAALLPAGGDVSRHWPTVLLESAALTGSLPLFHLDEARACLPSRQEGSYLELDRNSMTATFGGERPGDAHVLAHPGLAGVGAIMAWWLGRIALHGGAVVAAGGAWGVLGGKMQGKSTLLAALTRAGYPLLADDLLIFDDGHVFAGPRTLSLRLDAADHLGGDLVVVHVGAEERAHMPVGVVPGHVKLQGLILLQEAPWEGLELVPTTSRLAMLGAQFAVRRTPLAPTAFLDLAAVPFWTLTRPRHWPALAQSVAAIATLIGPPHRNDG